MKYLKFFENYNKEHFVGFHCNDSTDKILDGEFIGNIKEEYYDRFEEILNLIKFDFPSAISYLERINSDEEFGYDSQLAWDIEEFLEDNKIQWIFVSTDKPNTSYGFNCYSVYFRSNLLWSMEDTMEKNAMIYLYIDGVNNPILKH